MRTKTIVNDKTNNSSTMILRDQPVPRRRYSPSPSPKKSLWVSVPLQHVKRAIRHVSPDAHEEQSRPLKRRHTHTSTDYVGSDTYCHTVTKEGHQCRDYVSQGLFCHRHMPPNDDADREASGAGRALRLEPVQEKARERAPDATLDNDLVLLLREEIERHCNLLAELKQKMKGYEANQKEDHELLTQIAKLMVTWASKHDLGSAQGIIDLT